MASTKISALTGIDALASGDKVPVADASDLTATKSATMTQVAASVLGGNTITAGTGTLTIAAGKTLTYNNSVTLAGTDGTTITMPAVTSTLLPNTGTSGVGVTPTASGTTAITHGLGRTPTMIRIWGKSGFTSNAAATPTTSSEGIWNSSGNRCIYQSINGTTTIAAQTSTTFAVFLDTSVGNTISGVIQNVGATTFDIVWTETGTHTRGVYMWECQ